MKLVKKGIRSNVSFDYGECVFGERILDIKEGLRVLSDLYQDDDAKRRLTILNYGNFPIQRKSKLRRSIVRSLQSGEKKAKEYSLKDLRRRLYHLLGLARGKI